MTNIPIYPSFFFLGGGVIIGRDNQEEREEKNVISEKLRLGNSLFNQSCLDFITWYLRLYHKQLEDGTLGVTMVAEEGGIMEVEDITEVAVLIIMVVSNEQISK